MKCFGRFSVTADITDAIEGTGLYCGGSFTKAYPKVFKTLPLETISVQGSNGIVWIANKGLNTLEASGNYTIISTASANNIEYIISIQAVGMYQ